MGNTSITKPTEIISTTTRLDKNQGLKTTYAPYKCKYHSQTEFDTITISPKWHSFIIDGYIRQNCSSFYIIPNDVSITCQNMVWGLNYYTIIVNRNDLKTITSPKQMNNKNINNNGIDTRRDSTKYDMNTLYHKQRGEFNFYGLPFEYILQSDGIDFIYLFINTHFKYQIIAQISLFCQQTNDLIRFSTSGTLRIDINKCKSFHFLCFICKANIFERHQVISHKKCKIFINDYIQIEENSKYKYEFNKNTFLLKSKQIMNRYYLKPFGFYKNWALSISHRDETSLFSIQLEMLKIPSGLTIHVLFKYEIMCKNNNFYVKDKQIFSYSLPTKIITNQTQTNDRLENRIVFKSEKDAICLSQMIISVDVSILRVIGINGTVIPKYKWTFHNIYCTKNG